MDDPIFLDPPFTTADHITGTIVFDTFDNSVDQFDLPARSFSLNTTIGGGPGFGFVIPDALSDARVDFNQFDFAANSLQPFDFELTVIGEVFGGFDGVEILSISSVGDFVGIDEGGIGQATALNFSPGSFTAVPEPSSLMLLGTALSVGCLFRRQRTKVTS